MKPEKLEKLSRLVDTLVDERGHLKNEIRRLNERIHKLDLENRAILEKNHQFLSELEKLNFLEDGNRKMEEDKSVIRSKIQSILENIEKMDFT